MWSHVLRLVILLVLLFALAAPISGKWIVVSWTALALIVVHLLDGGMTAKA